MVRLETEQYWLALSALEKQKQAEMEPATASAGLQYFHKARNNLVS